MSQDNGHKETRAMVSRALESKAVQIPPALDNAEYSIRASVAIVRLIAKDANIQIGKSSDDDDGFVAGIFAFVVSNHITYIMAAPFEMVSSIVVIDLFGQQAANEVRTLANSYNRMAQEGRTIEAIGQNVAKWISTPTDERFDNLVALYKLCREHV
jgi:hypothetical protein